MFRQSQYDEVFLYPKLRVYTCTKPNVVGHIIFSHVLANQLYEAFHSLCQLSPGKLALLYTFSIRYLF